MQNRETGELTPLDKMNDLAEKVKKGLETMGKAAKARDEIARNYRPVIGSGGQLKPAKGQDLATFNESLKDQGYNRSQRRRMLSNNHKRRGRK